MLNCQQIAQISSDYLDRTDLSWQQRTQFKLHLMICSTCRRFVGQLDLLRHALQSKPTPAPNEAQIARWLQAIPPTDDSTNPHHPS